MNNVALFLMEPVASTFIRTTSHVDKKSVFVRFWFVIFPTN